jgi:hypothetical protein
VGHRATLESMENLASTRVQTIQPVRVYSIGCTIPTARLYNYHVYLQSYRPTIAQVTGQQFHTERPGFNPTVVHIGSVVAKMALQQVSL